MRRRRESPRATDTLRRAPHVLLLALFILSPALASTANRGAVQYIRIEAEQSQPWRVTSFIEDAALEGRGIFFFDFEADGTVWVAASDGLYRYDGYRWDRFSSEDGLPSDYVRCVRVTREGKLWVGTDRGAGLFDGETFDPAGSEGHLAGPSVRRIVEDPDGTLWFCCDQWPPASVEAGLTRYRDGKWKTWRTADGLPSDYVSDVFRDSTGQHLVLTRRGLAQIDGERLRRPFEEAGLHDCEDYVWSAVEDPDGDVITTTDAWVCVRKNGRWHRVPNGPPRIRRGQLASTRNGAILACTNEPVARFVEWKDDRFVPIRSAQLDTQSGVQHIGEAPDGAIWVAGFSLLARWERLGGEWRSFSNLPQPRLRDVEGGIWFAEKGRVLRLKDDRWTRYSDASEPLVGDSSGGVWMDTAGGLARWRRDDLTHFTEETIGVVNPRDVSVDGKGDLWVVGTGSDGRERLARFDGDSWTPYSLTDVRPTERIAEGTPDARVGMWYVLADSATDLFRLVRVDGGSIAELPLPETARRYWKPNVRTDRTGRLWLFGHFGLFKRDPGADGSEWQLVTGLPGRQVVNVIARETDVWFSYLGSTGGSGGVSRLLDGTWRHFSSAARDLTSGYEDGAFFFTLPGGMYIVDRDPAKAPRLVALPEPARIESLVAGPQEDLWVGSATRVFHHRPDGIPPDTVIVDGDHDVPHGRDLILRVRGAERFKPRFVSRNFNVAVQVDDRPWGEFEPLLDATITVGGLTAGDHVVRVRVQDEGLDIDPTPATWRFRLRAVPLQDRSWFRPLAAGVFLTVLFLVAISILARQREVAQRRKKHQLEHEILQISEREQRRIGRDLHDGLGQRLTSISFQCKALHGILERGDTPSPQRVREIGAAVRTAISETRVLAHALYPAEIDAGSLEIALGNLVVSVDRTFDGECTFHHDWSPAGLSREDCLNVYRLVQEALGNAIRHAGAQTLRVASRRDGGQWVVEVRDDGRGFDPEDTPGAGLGLQIMRYRANLIGGNLEVTSKPGAGTTIRCAVRI